MNVPDHVAIIMDGNGRWANKRFLPRSSGHWFGFKRAKEITYYAAELGVKHLTMFAFGRENWKRPESEVSFLMKRFTEQIDKLHYGLHLKNIRIRCIGDKSRLPQGILNKVDVVEKLTAGNTGLFLDIAIDYSGQFDIVQAVNRIIKSEINTEISEDEFAKYLLNCSAPPVDLLIRTGGESRISNFLLYQIAYAEIYFSELMWPAFNKNELDKIIKWFNQRSRRFGMTPEQLRQK